MATTLTNRFLDRLPAADRAALEPLLRPVTVKAGQVMVEQGGVVTDVHFPLDAQFANQTRFPDGQAIETAVVGCEGVTGLAPFMATKICAWEIVARTAGSALAVNASAFRAVAAQRPSLMLRLISLMDFYQAQAAQNAACNAVHQTTPRVARWLLTARDLSVTDTVLFTQDELARMLGTQRTTINEAAHGLRDAGLITYSRGKIRITNRRGLEGVSCSCYAVLRERLELAAEEVVG